ncbi:glycine--tRNA ligase beta subunit [Anaplasma platys]|uniref:Glycine--tRNA ligase beta subunit n=1 Tax=Anaplasma platys TaxID=949 RepID=A0A858PX47_9RICK|nr:glycine--tRNA ligase subunit beta [Anaplasma platys]QJC27152.1 glycine--tRNA ligase beta subunit [Anaplasma platys]
MSSDLVFEILCEQIPKKTQEDARVFVTEMTKDLLGKVGLQGSKVETYTSPNRISLLVAGIEVVEKNESGDIRGPRVGSAEIAIKGFLKKVGKEKKEDLEIRRVAGVDFYFGKIEKKDYSLPLEKVRSVLQEIVDKFPLHKRMKWGKGRGEWIRPVINVLCIFGGEVVPVRVAGVEANGLTYGNLRFQRTAHTVKGMADYLSFLEQNLVIVDHEKRKKHIIDGIDKLIGERDLKYEKEDKIIDELNSMLEYPHVVLGRVDESFHWVPKEVTLCVMMKHQRYLALCDKEGRIVKFATVATVVNERVVKTHEMTLRARLADAAFLIEKDKSTGLEQYVEHLEKIVFKKELGNVLEKVRRVTSLANYFAVWVPRAPILSVNRAAMLAKADLATLMVREFPDLQGKMGRYYAAISGEDKEVCTAIEEHYHPRWQRDRVPVNPVAIAISLADKVDSLVGLMATENITGSRDPYALRRLSISLLRVILENSINIPLDLMVAKSVALYVADTKKKKNLRSTFEVMGGGKITEKVLDFCYDRLKVLLRDVFELDREIINIVVGSCHDVVVVKRKIRIIGDYIKTEEGQLILTAYRRIKNVVEKRESGTPFRIPKIWNKCSEKLCVESCEIEVYKKAKECESLLNSLLKENNFSESLLVLVDLSKAVQAFMDGVLINSEDAPELRTNRENLALWLVEIYNAVVDFSQIPK